MERAVLHDWLDKIRDGEGDVMGLRQAVWNMHKKGTVGYYKREVKNVDGWDCNAIQLAAWRGLEEAVRVLVTDAGGSLLGGRKKGGEVVGLEEDVKERCPGVLKLFYMKKAVVEEMVKAAEKFPEVPDAGVWEEKVDEAIKTAHHLADTTGPAYITPSLLLASYEIADTHKRHASCVINCCPDTVTTTPPPPAEYHTIHCDDDPSYPIITHATEVVSLIKTHLTTHPNPSLILHCYGGVNRSAFFTVAYLMHTGMGLLEAVVLVYEKRPIILTNKSFRAQLVRLAYSWGTLR